MPIRFAIWVAVSSKGQAAHDKISLSDQEKQCRAVGSGKGWIETGSFVVPGESRTKYINLRDAENDIPQLKQALQSAQAGDYDILVMYDYNRMRDLIDPVAKTLSNYGVQIYSISQPVEPQRPESYRPYASDSESMVRGLAQIMSRAQINDFRRKYKVGMPGRIKSGLPKGKAPYGFRKPIGRETDRKAIPERDPIKSEIVIKIKNMFLSGYSLWQIANALTAEEIPTPAGKAKWSDVNVRLILKNRFYVGEVLFGRTYIVTDSAGKTTVFDNPPSEIIVARGLHTPLWDMQTQTLIEEEFEKRGKKYTGIKRQRLSNLLYCAECGARCWVEYPGGYSDHSRAWACSVDPRHVRRRDTDVLAALVGELPEKLRQQAANIPEQTDDSSALIAKLNDLTSRRTRLLDAYEAGSLSLIDYANRVPDIEAKIKRAQNEILDHGGKNENRINRINAILHFAEIISQVPDYITHGPPQEVNGQLRAILSAIIIGKDTLDVKFNL